MSDYISKSALIEALNKEEKEFEDCVLMPTWYSALSVFHNQPTISETEIIRKAFERVVERLEEEAKENDYTAWQFDDDGTEYIKEKYEEIASAYREAIKIVKEECGINE